MMELGESQFPEPEGVIRTKIQSKVYSLRFKAGRSMAWDMFGRIETETGEVIPGIVACKRCIKICKVNRYTTSNLLKHKCCQRMRMKAEMKANTVIRNENLTAANIDTETKKNVERLVLQWTIENCRPIDVIEDSGLQKLAECLIETGAKYGPTVDMEDLLPQPAEMLKNVLKLHTDYMEKLKTELTLTRNVGYGLTAGVWRDEYLWTTYLFLTIHCIKDGELVNRFLGLESIEGDKCTSEDIDLAAEEILRKFDYTLDDKPTVVTDNSENMVEAFHTNDRVFCFNHLLQNVIEQAIDGTPEVKEICQMTTKVFNFLKTFNTTFVNPLGSGSTKRWHAILHMLTSISTNWLQVVKIGKCHQGEAPRIIERMNLSHIKALIHVLEPFDEVSKELECDDGPTLPLAIAHAHRLRKMCINNTGDIEIKKKFKANLLAFYDAFVWNNMTLLHKIALYFFPPANKLISFSQSDKDMVRAECQRIMQTFVIEEAPETSIAYSAMQIDDKQSIHHFDEFSEDDEKEAPNISTRSIKNPNIFEDFVETKEKLSNVEEKVKNEMRLYEETSVMLCDNFNLLQWWHENKTHFPLLYKTSCKILSIPATCAASERAILKARPLIFEQRSAVDGNPEHLNEILFLHFNVEKNEMFSDVKMEGLW